MLSYAVPLESISHVYLMQTNSAEFTFRYDCLCTHADNKKQNQKYTCETRSIVYCLQPFTAAVWPTVREINIRNKHCRLRYSFPSSYSIFARINLFGEAFCCCQRVAWEIVQVRRCYRAALPSPQHKDRAALSDISLNGLSWIWSNKKCFGVHNFRRSAEHTEQTHTKKTNMENAQRKKNTQKEERKRKKR